MKMQDASKSRFCNLLYMITFREEKSIIYTDLYLLSFSNYSKSKVIDFLLLYVQIDVYLIVQTNSIFFIKSNLKFLHFKIKNIYI